MESWVRIKVSVFIIICITSYPVTTVRLIFVIQNWIGLDQFVIKMSISKV